MKNKITSSQLMFAAAVSIISISLVTKHLYSFTKNDTWFTVLAGFLLSLMIYQIYALLAGKFPDRTLVEINDSVFGAVLGKFMSVLYLFFIFSITCLNTNIITGFISAFILPNTPMPLILFLFIFVCAMAVRKGPVKLMRYSALFVYVSVAVILINSLLLYKIVDFKNLPPSFCLPLTEYVFSIQAVTVIPLCDPFILLMFLPDMLRPKEFGKAAMKGLTIGTAVLLFIVVRDITVLGPRLALAANPAYASVRQIDVGDVLTRMDIIYISILVSLMFYKVAVLLAATLTGVQRLLKFDSSQLFVNIFGALLLLFSLTVFRSSSEHIEWLMNGAGEFYQTFFLIIMPLATLITAVCRGFFKKDGSTPVNDASKGGNRIES